MTTEERYPIISETDALLAEWKRELPDDPFAVGSLVRAREDFGNIKTGYIGRVVRRYCAIAGMENCSVDFGGGAVIGTEYPSVYFTTL